MLVQKQGEETFDMACVFLRIDEWSQLTWALIAQQQGRQPRKVRQQVLPVLNAARMLFNLNSNGAKISRPTWCVELSCVLLDALWMFHPFLEIPCLHVARAAYGRS